MTMVTSLQKEILAKNNVQVSSSASSVSFTFEDVIREVEERREKERNIIIFNLSESDSRDDDIKAATDVLKFVNGDQAIQADRVKCFRLGKTAAPGKCRPLKFVMNSAENFILFGIVSIVAAQKQYRPSSPGQVATILRQANDVNPDGSYQWSFEADNGISAQEQGRLGGGNEPAIQAQGGFQYTAPDGSPISLTYVADENGFQPQGAHLPVAPTPPPIPDYILRSIEYNAAHPEPEQRQTRF
ncbi:cuticle protein [Holotrichia oblita]|uniref:Cuticle protein n=1 Tax=Holotrichia oblita TaxID=644536 RepID=A0ACB9TFS1_HOLOL|nr:cuticle protein [Holotrichia oblita]